MFEKIIIFLSGIKCDKVNPIEYDILLRTAGQSLDEKIHDIRFNFIEEHFQITGIMAILLMIVIAFNLHFSLMFTIIIFWLVFIFRKTAKIIKLIRSYALGRDGEKSVAQYLNIVSRQVSKESSNMHIYHDILNRKKAYNIDHVVVSKKGIFLFETKTFRKEKGIVNTIFSDGKVLYKNKTMIKNDIPLQVKGQTKWLKSELKATLGKEYEIISTIVFVGWLVEGKKIENFYVTNPRNIKNILENKYSRIIYNDEELKRITSVMHKLSCNKSEEIFDICDKNPKLDIPS